MTKKEINIGEIIEKELSRSLITKIDKRVEIEKFLTNEDIFLIETTLRNQGVSRAAFSKYLNITIDSMKRMSDNGDNGYPNGDNIQIISEIIETKEIKETKEKWIPEIKNEKNKIETIETIDTKNYLNKKIASNQNVTTDILLEKINQLESKLESKFTDLSESVALKIKEVREERGDREDIESRFEAFPKDTAVHAFRCNSWIVKEVYKIAEKKKWTIKKSINIAMLLFIENYQEDEDNNDDEEKLTNEF